MDPLAHHEDWTPASPPGCEARFAGVTRKSIAAPARLVLRPGEGGHIAVVPTHAIRGPAAMTSSGHESSNFLKFSMNRAASCRYLSMYPAWLGQVPAGLRISAGTPSHDCGTSKPKTGSRA